MSERPSDSMQPVSKRRAAEQMRKEDLETEDDDEGCEAEDPGWRPADEETIKARRRVHVRRRGEPHTEDTTGQAPSAGPFAGITLAKPASNPFAGVSLTAGIQSANPFSAVRLAAASAPVSPPVVEAKTEEEKDAANAGSQQQTVETDKSGNATPSDAAEAKNDKDAHAEAAAAAKERKAVEDSAQTQAPAGFGFPPSGASPWAAVGSSGKPFGSGSGFGGGFGGFGAVAKASESTSPKSIFGGNGNGFQFPAVQGSTTTAFVRGEATENVQLFGKTDNTLSTPLPAEKKVTGEEDETNVFSADGVLYEFDQPNAKWRERGRGEFRVNLNSTDQARMVMRQAGNFRLLLNAKVYSGMPVQKMAGNAGVTFGCINMAAQSAAAAPATATGNADAVGEAAAADKKEEPTGSQGSSAAGPKMSTWAVKVKSPDKVSEMLAVLERHREAHRAA